MSFCPSRSESPAQSGSCFPAPTWPGPATVGILPRNFCGMAPQWRKSVRARSPTGFKHTPHWQLPSRQASPRSTISPTGVSRTLVPDHHSFPGVDHIPVPAVHIARYWISSDQPCDKNGKEVSTCEHRFTPCPGRPHEKHTLAHSITERPLSAPPANSPADDDPLPRRYFHIRQLALLSSS